MRTGRPKPALIPVTPRATRIVAAFHLGETAETIRLDWYQATAKLPQSWVVQLVQGKGSTKHFTGTYQYPTLKQAMTLFEELLLSRLLTIS